MTYCWGVDKPSHDAQEFMEPVSDWMIERVSFRSVPVLCMNNRLQGRLNVQNVEVALPGMTDFFQIGSLVAHQALH